MTSTSTDRRQGVNAGAAFKVACRAATTANIALSGLQTIDGIVLAQDDRVLVKNQNTGADNGIYLADSGTWTRAVDCDGTYDLKHGTLVLVHSGTVSAGLVYECTAADTITIGTTALTWAVTNPGAPISVPVSIAQGGTSGTTAVTGLAGLGVVACTAVGGTANAITCTVDSTVTAYRTNQIFELTPTLTNTGAATFTPTPSGAGALAGKNIKKRTSGGRVALVANDLIAGNTYLLQYDGTDLILEGARTYAHGADIASAATINLDTATGDCVDVTGVVAITAITLAEGEARVVRFTGALTLTNGASLVLPGGANITTAAGDYAVFRGYAAGVVRCVAYIKASGAPINMSEVTASLGADVALNNTAVAFDGPSIAQGTAGRWFVSATVTLVDTGVAAQFQIRLYDGTTTIAAATATSGAANSITSGSVSGFITSPTGNLRVSVKDVTAVTGKILFNNTGLSKDSTITAIRVG